MHTVIDVETIRPGTYNYVLKLLWEVPWPYKDRESVSESVWQQDHGSKVVRLDFKSIEDSSSNDEYQRMVVSGSWTYTPMKGGRVHVVYESHANPGGNLPPLLVNPFCSDVPVKTFENLRKEVKNYENASVPWIVNNI